MAKARQLAWRQAIIKVLRDAEGPVHYADIAHEI